LSKAGDRAIIILKIQTDSLKKPLDYDKIEKGVAGLSGVTNVQINHTTNMIKVRYDPEHLNVKTIREKLEELQKLTPP